MKRVTPAMPRAVEHGSFGDGCADLEAGPGRTAVQPGARGAQPSAPDGDDAHAEPRGPPPAADAGRRPPTESATAAAAPAAEDQPTDDETGATDEPEFAFAPTPMRLGYTFAEPALELCFRQQEVRPVLGARMALLALAACVELGAASLAEWLLPDGSPLYGRLCSAGCAYQAAWALALYGAHRCARVPLRALELASTAMLSVLAIALPTVLSKTYLAATLGVPADELGAVPGRLTAIVLLSAVALFVPLDPAHFACCAAATLAGAVLGALPPGSAEADLLPVLFDKLALAVLVLALQMGQVRCARSERLRFDLRRMIDAAVAERAAAQRQLRRITTSVAKSARSRLIRMVMHDLRSPLLSVNHIAHVLLDMPTGTPLGDATVRESLGSLDSCSSLMEGIVSDMLDFERIEAGRLVLVRAPFAPAQLLRGGLATFSSLAEKKGVRLIAEELPEDLRALRLVGDVRRLQQCLNNGISNAIKFTDTGGVVSLRAALAGVAAAPAADADDDETVRVDMHSGSSASRFGAIGAGSTSRGSSKKSRGSFEGAQWVHVTFSVKDSGIGLAPAELSSLQHALQRGDVFSQVGRGQLQGSGGTGLGLSIVRQVLAQHDGSKLHISSAGPSQGTLFEIQLKCRAHPEHAHRDPESPPEQHAKVGLAQLRQLAAASPTRKYRSRTHDPISLGSPGADEPKAGRMALPILSAHTRMGVDSPMTLDSPRAAEHAAASTAAHEPADAGTGGAGVAARPVRVLHAEDDVILRKSIALRIFKKMGVEVTQVANGQQALDAVRESGSFDLILMDNQMPGVNGTAATRELRRSGYRGLIIGLTGDPPGAPEVREFEAAGLNMCLGKDSQGTLEIIEQIKTLQTGLALKAQAASGHTLPPAVAAAAAQAASARHPAAPPAVAATPKAWPAADAPQADC